MSAYYGNGDLWRDDAACKGWPTNAFFPTRSTGGKAPHYGQDIRALCETCPVRRQCLDDALNGEAHLSHAVLGYRGGKTPEQRLDILRQQGRRISERQAQSRSRRHLVARARRSGVNVDILAAAYGIDPKTVVRLSAGSR